MPTRRKNAPTAAACSQSAQADIAAESQPGADSSAGSVSSQWALNPVQARFLACAERFSFYVGGVGAGKTFAGALRALVRALEQPGSLGLIGAPTYPMLRDATQRTFFELLEQYALSRGEDAALIKSFQKVEGHLTLANGSEILFRSLDAPDRIRGLNLAWFWLDEAPLCGYYAWQILKGRLRQPGYDLAGWATGTPHGRDGFWRDFEHAPRPHHALFRAATQENAAHLPADYISDLGLTGAFYDQEVLGLFTAFEGLVYAFTADADGNVGEAPTPSPSPASGRGEPETAGHADRHPATTSLSRSSDGAAPLSQGDTSRLRSPLPRTGEGLGVGASAFPRVIGGVDWGYTNPTAALVFGIDGDDRAWQLDEFYQRRAPLDAVVLPALCDLTARYGVETWYCGPDEPEHIAALQAALIQAGLPARALPAEDAVRPGIQTVTRLLARRDDGTRGLYVAPRCVHTIAEFGTYQYPSTDSLHATGNGSASGTPLPQTGEGLGVGVSELPLKQNDHAMDALRYALHTALGRQSSRATDTYLALYLSRGGKSSPQR
jgi:hypothetical protein